jgi:hypothetical protein
MCLREARDGVPFEHLLEQRPLGFGDHAFKRSPGLHEGRLFSRRGQPHVHLAITGDAAVKIIMEMSEMKPAASTGSTMGPNPKIHDSIHAGANGSASVLCAA